MCRGCRLYKNKVSTCHKYLDWLDEYLGQIHQMKKVEKMILGHQQGLDSKEHKKALDSFRRQLIRVRREYAKAEGLLKGI